MVEVKVEIEIFLMSAAMITTVNVAAPLRYPHVLGRNIASRCASTTSATARAVEAAAARVVVVYLLMIKSRSCRSNPSPHSRPSLYIERTNGLSSHEAY